LFRDLYGQKKTIKFMCKNDDLSSRVTAYNCITITRLKAVSVGLLL